MTNYESQAVSTGVQRREAYSRGWVMKESFCGAEMISLKKSFQNINPQFRS